MSTWNGEGQWCIPNLLGTDRLQTGSSVCSVEPSPNSARIQTNKMLVLVKWTTHMEGSAYLRSWTAYFASTYRELGKGASREKTRVRNWREELGLKSCIRNGTWSNKHHSWLRKQDSDVHKRFQTSHSLGLSGTEESAGCTSNHWAETTLGSEDNGGENVKSFMSSLFQWVICLIQKDSSCWLQCSVFHSHYREWDLL